MKSPSKLSPGHSFRINELFFVNGLALNEIVRRLGPLPADCVAAIGRSVAAALEYASRNGLIHRDVKPSNIMINELGEVKLLDLGLARFQLSQQEADGTKTRVEIPNKSTASISEDGEVNVRVASISPNSAPQPQVGTTYPYSQSNSYRDANSSPTNAVPPATIRPNTNPLSDPTKSDSVDLREAQNEKQRSIETVAAVAAQEEKKKNDKRKQLFNSNGKNDSAVSPS